MSSGAVCGPVGSSPPVQAAAASTTTPSTRRQRIWDTVGVRLAKAAAGTLGRVLDA